MSDDDDRYSDHFDPTAKNMSMETIDPSDGHFDAEPFRCAQCRSPLFIPAEADPNRDDVRVCKECFEPANTEFLSTHHSDAVAIGVYPIAGGGDPR